VDKHRQELVDYRLKQSSYQSVLGGRQRDRIVLREKDHIVGSIDYGKDKDS
jgi:hypothetical protein